MALPSSGPISVYQVATEFGKAYNMAAFYGVASGIPTSGAISLAQFYGKAAAGEAAYTANADFTVPSGVTSISFVAVGRGANGTWERSGGGGALGYKNNVAVTAGQVVQVRFTGAATTVTVNGVTYTAGDGNSHSGGARSGAWDGGGNGGAGYNSSGSGGGGAGGYTSTGGQGGSNNYSGFGSATGGGGGGGSNASYAKGGGGGVGLKGIISGASSDAAPGVGGGGGQGGTNGDSSYTPNGGTYGGGAGAAQNNSYTSYGGAGAVRIIWGAGRSFPYAAS